MFPRIFHILILCSLIFGNLSAQKDVFSVEKEMSIIFDTIFSLNPGDERDSLNDFLLDSFSEILQNTDALYYPWKNLNKIGNLVSEDERLRIFTWHLTLDDGGYKYYGFLLFNRGINKKGKEDIVVYNLNDNSENLKNAEMLSLSNDNWYGALYYKIVTFSFRKENYYVLMGYDFHDRFSQKKIIEVLRFGDDGIAHFEGKFDLDFQQFKRIIFEYSDDVAMSVNYNENLEMIVYDHLSPFQPIFSGVYRFYGPDGSYDGLQFNKSIFHLKKDIDARN